MDSWIRCRVNLYAFFLRCFNTLCYASGFYMLLFVVRCLWCACMRARVCVIHWHCTAQLSMFNMEKRYRNKIIIIIIIIIIEQSGSKDPYAAFGGNMAALQRNQVTVVGLKTNMPPLAEIWLLCSVSSAPVAQMKLHECNILLYFRTGPPVVKLSQCPYIATKSRM